MQFLKSRIKDSLIWIRNTIVGLILFIIILTTLRFLLLVRTPGVFSHGGCYKAHLSGSDFKIRVKKESFFNKGIFYEADGEVLEQNDKRTFRLYRGHSFHPLIYKNEEKILPTECP